MHEAFCFARACENELERAVCMSVRVLLLCVVCFAAWQQELQAQQKRLSLFDGRRCLFHVFQGDKEAEMRGE